MYIIIFIINVKNLCLQVCDFGLARLEEPRESAIMTQEVSTFPIVSEYQVVWTHEYLQYL